MDPSFFCNSTNLDPEREWCIKTSQLNYIVMCYKQTLSQKEGLWTVGINSSFAVPTFLSQLVIVISITRLLMFAFRPLRLPRISAEILGGVILGTGGLGRTMFGRDYLFPFKSLLTLETIANLGLLYYMFLLGLELDIKPVMQTPNKAFTTAFSGFLLPFPAGYFLHYMLVDNFPAVTSGLPTTHGPLLWGIALSATNFPELAHILVDLKLLRSDIGRTALPAAVITDLSTWLLLVISTAVFNGGPTYSLGFGTAFIVFSFLGFRPALSSVVGLTSERVVEGGGGGYNDYHVSMVLALVGAFGYVADACGCHSILGGFLLGLIMPKGELKEKTTEKVEDFVSGFMMPLFFMIIGLRTNHAEVFAGQIGIGKIVGVLGVAFVAKIASTFLVAVFVNKMRPRDGLALGLLMNTKGLLTLVVISSARDMKVLNNETFTILLTALWLMTAAVGPVLSFVYKSGKHSGEGKRSSSASGLQPHDHSQLRVLACFHSSQEVTGIANLLDASNPTKTSPITVFALHLVEHVRRASAMLIVHDACRVDGGGGGGGEDNSDHNEQRDSSAATQSAAFNDLKVGKELGAVSVHPLTALSTFATMHEDICGLAEEKQADLIILPFHLNPAADGGGAEGNPFRIMNKHVLENSPCSVAVLVDRGHRPPTVLAKFDSRGRLCRRFFVIFIGGPDDREALAYARRMSGNPTISLMVTRFTLANENRVELSTEDEEKEEKLLDEHCLEQFCRETENNSAVKLTETAVRDGDGIVKAIKDIDGEEYDLIIIGRGKERALPIMAGSSSEWSEFPELGPLGDTLACSSFAANAWILVVQQGGGCDIGSGGGGDGGDDGARESDQVGENSGTLNEHFCNMTWEPHHFQKPDLSPFVNRGTKSF